MLEDTNSLDGAQMLQWWLYTYYFSCLYRNANIELITCQVVAVAYVIEFLLVLRQQNW